MPLAEWVHSLATLGWLCGSSMWMTAQLLFEPEIHASKAVDNRQYAIYVYTQRQQS